MSAILERVTHPLGRRAPLIRLVAGAAAGCVLAGLFESVLIGGGPFATLGAVAVAVWLWPVVFIALCGLRLMWTGPVLTAARRAEHRASVQAAGVLLGAGLWVLRPTVQAATAFFVSGFRDPALIAPASAAVAAGMVIASIGLGVALFGPLRWLFARWDHPLVPALGVVAALGGAVLSLWAPVLELSKDMPRWPAASLAVAVLGALAAHRLLDGRPRTGIGVLLGALGLASLAPALVERRPDIEQALVDGLGLTGLLAPVFVSAEAQLTVVGAAEGDPLQPPAPDEGSPVEHGPLPPALHGPWNILLVTIDAVRADHLPLYGYGRDTAPNLSALGARSAVFERAYTSVNATRWLIPSLFTGRMIGDVDQMHAGHYTVLQPGSGQIFERLRAAGWRTEAHNAAHIRSLWFGIEAGFDAFAGYPAARLRGTSSAVLAGAVEEALERLSAHDPPRSWAMWVHLLDPHEPYTAREGFDFGDEPVDRYDAEIAAADAGLGRMLAALDAHGLAESTIVVVTSDHGEEFGEHGRKYHGKQLYEESIRVPLVIHVPGLEPRRLAAPVSLIDIAPTLAHLGGLPPARRPGLVEHRARSLVPVMAGGPEDMDRAVFVDCIRKAERYTSRKMAMIRGHEKLIVGMDGVEGRRARFYDLAVDPEERTNLRWTAPERYAALAAPLEVELARRRQNETARLLSRRVSTTPPPGLTGTPIEIRPGLELLGSRVDGIPWVDRRLPIVRAWFRVSSAQPDLTIRHDYLDEAGKPLKSKSYRPMLGLYPTSAWRPGQVIEDLRMVRFRPAPRRYAKVMLSVLQDGRPIFGPHPLGKMVPDARTVRRGGSGSR